MSHPKLSPMHLHHYLPLVISLLLALSPAMRRCTALISRRDEPPYKPLVSPLAKDPATSLYTISIKSDGAPLVVDLAGPLVWSTCASNHATFPCGSRECAAANGGRNIPAPASCGHEADDGGGHQHKRQHCACTAHPCNPVTGRCAAGDLTSVAMSANATDGRSLLGYEASFSAAGSCAPDRLLRSLPAGAAGVAGLSRAPLSLPSQLAVRRGVGGGVFALCLPGVAVFGNTSIYLGFYPLDLASTIASTPLVRNPKRSGGYYIPARAVSVFWDQVETPAALPAGALEIDPVTGRGGVTLSTVAQYTAMRSDVYRPFIQAFNATMNRPGSYVVVSKPAVKPFELCYDTWSLRRLRVTGWDVPIIRLELGAGATKNWTVSSGNSMLQVADRTLCVAIVEMGAGDVPGSAAADGAAVVIGGYQLEDNLLVFDAEREELRFSGLLWGSGAICRGFNFTSPS